MSEVTTSVDVEVPVRTAYNQWTQFESFPEFMSGVVAVRQLDDRHLHWVTEVAGARREFDAEIVEQLPDDHIAWRSTDGDVTHRGSVRFQPLSHRQTRITVDLAWEPVGLLEKAGGVLGMDRLQVKADLQRFRRYIETRRSETGEWRGRVPDPPEVAVDGAPLAGTMPPPAGAQTVDDRGHSTDDVIDILLAQHRQIADLMARTTAAEGPEKRRLFGELAELLRTHERGEQHVVHSITRVRTEGGPATANARLAEEERADQMIAELEKTTSNPREFDVWFEQLCKAVLDHAAHEEREEFPKLREQVEPMRLRTMAEELIAVQTARN